MERPPMDRALSTDVLLDMILSHLNVQDLLECRYVSKFWNKAASLVLRKRSTWIKRISTTNTLKKLGECLKQNSDFPFTTLILLQPWKFSSTAAMVFFKKYGTRFTSLFLGTWPDTRLQAPFLNHFPHLSRIELVASGLPPKLLDSAAGQEDGPILNLPALRTLRIYSYESAGALHEVCKAASELLRIECMRTSYRILKGLKSAGKLQAVSVLYVCAEKNQKDDDALRVDQLLSTESPSLTKLVFMAGGCISRNGLMKLLISSQHTLKELCLRGIYPSEFLSECPVLPKLTRLILYISDKSDADESEPDESDDESDDEYDAKEYVFPDESIFQGRQGHKFPALKQLTLEIEVHPSVTINFSDGLFVVPNLPKIDLVGYVRKTGIEDLARSFPNVIEVGLIQKVYDFKRSWHTDPTDIWSVQAFKKLEKLVIWPYTIQSPTKIVGNFEEHKDFLDFKIFKMMNMDSFLTGMPIGICENLRKNPQQNLKDSQINEILRDSPNLLQLKNLKELIIYVMLEDQWDKLAEEYPFISEVSVLYALQMMPNLTTKFVYEYCTPAWYCDQEGGDEAVRTLEFAFKNVQPYLELEPFHY